MTRAEQTNASGSSSMLRREVQLAIISRVLQISQVYLGSRRSSTLEDSDRGTEDGCSMRAHALITRGSPSPASNTSVEPTATAVSIRSAMDSSITFTVSSARLPWLWLTSIRWAV